MGSVWLASDDVAQREVAIKLLHKALVGDATATARLRNEAAIAGQLRHRNVCTVLDVGESDGVPFLVMPRLRGESLADRLARRHTLEPGDAVAVVLPVLRGLESAHAAGILHRDLKPENVYLARSDDDDDAVPVILDFGVAKFLGDDAERVKMTRTGALVGTPAYMSPEQALGLDNVDLRSDVWAVGVMLYEMLAGCLPYEATNYNAMLVKIATEPPRRIEDLLPSLDLDLATIVHGALEPKPDDRIASASEFAGLLDRWLERTPHVSRSPRLSMPTPRISSTPMSWAERAPTVPATPNATYLTLGDPARRKRVWLVAIAALAVFGAGGATIWRSRVHSARAAPMRTAAPIAARTAIPAPMVTVDIRGVPAGARVTIDGVLVSLPARMPARERARVDVVAPGYDPWSETIAAVSDAVLQFEGRAVAPPVRTVEVARENAQADAGTNVASSGTDARSSNARPTAASRSLRANRASRGARRPAGGIARAPDF